MKNTNIIMKQLLIYQSKEKNNEVIEVLNSSKDILLPKTFSKKEYEVVTAKLAKKPITKVQNNYLNASIKYKLLGYDLVSKLRLYDLLFKKQPLIIEEKQIELHLNNIKILPSERLKTITSIFKSLDKFIFIKHHFITGSFITKKIFNDIDLLLFIDEKAILEDSRMFIKFLKDFLQDKLKQKFHINIFEDKQLNILSSDLSLFAMLNQSVGNKKISEKFNLDKLPYPTNNSFFLDYYLGIETGEYALYLSDFRTLIAYQFCLQDNIITSSNINKGLEHIITKSLLLKLKNKKSLTKKEQNTLKAVFLKLYASVYKQLYKKIKDKDKLLMFIKGNVKTFSALHKKNKDKNSYANLTLYKEVLNAIERNYSKVHK